jgi:NADPH:quinone reductase-like Zn-dependent oxidoreductase
MKYKKILVSQYGGPEVLQIIENELRPPGAKEARLKVLAASVSRPDVTVRRGEALYTGTPLAQKLPFTPGYAVIGNVDAVGSDSHGVMVGDQVGVLTVTGGYTEYLYWRSDRLIPISVDVDPAQAVTLILNYIVAYQTMHRVAKVQPGEKALIIGASGGIGTALLQLGRLAGLKMYAMASKSKHSLLSEYGATPIDYSTQDFAEEIHRAEPDGLDVVLDGMMSLSYIRRSLSLLRRGGRIVSYGEPAGLSELFRILLTFVRINLLGKSKSFKLYGTSTYFLGNQKPYLEDWAILFELLREGKIGPVIAAKFPILEAAKANQLLESGQVVGNVVLVGPELL